MENKKLSASIRKVTLQDTRKPWHLWIVERVNFCHRSWTGLLSLIFGNFHLPKEALLLYVKLLLPCKNTYFLHWSAYSALENNQSILGCSFIKKKDGCPFVKATKINSLYLRVRAFWSSLLLFLIMEHSDFTSSDSPNNPKTNSLKKPWWVLTRSLAAIIFSYVEIDQINAELATNF